MAKVQFINLLCATLLISISSTKLIVQSPPSLKSLFTNGEIQASNSNFGYIPYGHNMVSQISLVPDSFSSLGWQN